MRGLFSHFHQPHTAQKVTMISIGLISNIICTTEHQNKPRVACTQPKMLLWVISSRFIPNLCCNILRPLRDLNFTGSLSVDFITYSHGYSFKNSFLSLEAALLLVSAKNRDLWEGPIFRACAE